MTVENENTKMRVCGMMHQDQVWGNISVQTSVVKKGMKDRGKEAKLKIGIWVIFSLNSLIIFLITQAKLYKPKRPN